MSDAAAVNFVASEGLSKLKEVCHALFPEESIWSATNINEDLKTQILIRAGDIDNDKLSAELRELAELSQIEGGDVFVSKAFKFVTDDIIHGLNTANSERFGLPRSGHLVM